VTVRGLPSKVQVAEIYRPCGSATKTVGSSSSTALALKSRATPRCPWTPGAQKALPGHGRVGPAPSLAQDSPSVILTSSSPPPSPAPAWSSPAGCPLWASASWWVSCRAMTSYPAVIMVLNSSRRRSIPRIPLALCVRKRRAGRPLRLMMARPALPGQGLLQSATKLEARVAAGSCSAGPGRWRHGTHWRALGLVTVAAKLGLWLDEEIGQKRGKPVKDPGPAPPHRQLGACLGKRPP